MELPAHLDLHRIVFVQVGLSTLASTSVSPSYNLPIHLYGLYNIDVDIDSPSPASAEGLRQYCILLVLTTVLDLLWMYNWSSSTSALPFIMILIGLIIKPITLLTCLNQLNRDGRGFNQLSSQFGASRQAPFHGLNNHNTPHSNPHGGGINYRETPVWATSAQTKRSENARPPAPSAISHQATAAAAAAAAAAADEFGIDDHADAQRLSDDEVLQAKKELDKRIAQKKAQIQQELALNQNTPPVPPIQSNLYPAQSVDGSGYHTLE